MWLSFKKLDSSFENKILMRLIITNCIILLLVLASGCKKDSDEGTPQGSGNEGKRVKSYTRIQSSGSELSVEVSYSGDKVDEIVVVLFSEFDLPDSLIFSYDISYQGEDIEWIVSIVENGESELSSKELRHFENDQLVLRQRFFYENGDWVIRSRDEHTYESDLLATFNVLRYTGGVLDSTVVTNYSHGNGMIEGLSITVDNGTVIEERGFHVLDYSSGRLATISRYTNPDFPDSLIIRHDYSYLGDQLSTIEFNRINENTPLFELTGTTSFFFNPDGTLNQRSFNSSTFSSTETYEFEDGVGNFKKFISTPDNDIVASNFIY